MARWHVDEGLAVLIAQWKKEHPQATVYTIADQFHSATSEHAPERQGSEPGKDVGEVDAGDFMPGKGVSWADLIELRDNLVEVKDKRYLYTIIKDEIVSSVVSPWKTRKYYGKYHAHLHVSVNDRYENNRASWDIDGAVRDFKMFDLHGSFPELQLGDEDQRDKVQYITRIQGCLNAVYGLDLDTDGVYGPKTAKGIAHAMRTDKARTTTSGVRIRLPEARRILGVW